MVIGSVPGYKDVFKHSASPKMRELIKNVPSSTSIAYFSSISLTLSITPSIDQKIFLNRIFERIQEINEDVTNNFVITAKQWFLEYLNDTNSNYSFFQPYYITAYLEKEIQTPKTPAKNQSLAIFIIFLDYLIFVDDFNEKQHNTLGEFGSELTGSEFFIKNFWPLLIPQFAVRSESFPITGVIKALAELKRYTYLLPQKYITKFLRSYGCTEIEQYIGFLFNVLSNSFKAQTVESRSLIKAANEQTNKIFENMAVKPSDYGKSRSHYNFLAIRVKPLYKIEDNLFCILNWGFFSDKLSEGLRRDFYSKSGIDEIYSSYPDFKSKEISIPITEKFFFRNLIDRLFKDKRNIIKYDDNEKDGLPDGYIRYNNRIMIIEFKDYLVNAEEIALANPASFKKYMSKRFIKEKEGLPQLTEHIKKVKNGGFYFDKLNAKVLRNIKIYPFIVTWNNFFDLPALNLFLQESFNIPSFTSEPSQQRLYPLTLCSFDALLNRLEEINSKGTTDFLKLVSSYHKTVRDHLKLINKSNYSERNIHNCYLSFSQYLDLKFGRAPKNRNKHLDYLIVAFDIKELLKKG